MSNLDETPNSRSAAFMPPSAATNAVANPTSTSEGIHDQNPFIEGFAKKTLRRLGLLLAILAIVMIVASGPGHRLGLWDFRTGLKLVMASGWTSLVAVLSSLLSAAISLIRPLPNRLTHKASSSGSATSLNSKHLSLSVDQSNSSVALPSTTSPSSKSLPISMSSPLSMSEDPSASQPSSTAASHHELAAHIPSATNQQTPHDASSRMIPRRTLPWSTRAALVISIPLFALLASWARQAKTLPMIHDITTDTTHPPAFVAITPLRAGSLNPSEYGGSEIAAQQKRAYPEIKTETLNEPYSAAFEHALNTARAMNWKIEAADPASGRIEATDTTLWFGFQDDVVIRLVAQDANTTLIDMRSVSRVGKSDVGTNAQRIRKFMKRLLHSS